MATAITFPEFRKKSVQTNLVYFRNGVAGSWTLADGVYADEIRFSLSPSIGTAKLSYRYGYGKYPTDANWRTYARFDDSYLGQFVKIVIPGTSLTINGAPSIDSYTWYGLIESIADQANQRGGIQQIQCYSLDLLLERIQVTESTWRNSSGEYRVYRGITFNAGGFGNRSTGEVGGRSLFEDNRSMEEPTTWSTRDIVKYLLVEAAPRNAAGIPMVNFRLNTIAEDYLPDWDEPVVYQHGQTLRQLLNQLISNRRLLSYCLVPATDDDISTIDLVPMTFAGSPIVTQLGTIKANQSQYSIDTSADPSASRTIRTSTLNKYHQVRVQGARMRSCFTAKYDDNLVTAWESSLESDCELAASGAADYPASTEIDERRRRNREARSAVKFREVFCRFDVPGTWDEKAASEPVNVHPSQAYLADSTKLFTAERRILPTIPLKAGYDYSDDNGYTGGLKVTDGPHDELPPLVFVELPEDAGKYVYGERLGETAEKEQTGDAMNRKFSIRAVPAVEGTGIYLLVQGQDQHAICPDEFSGQAEDEDLGDVTWRDMRLTVAMELERHAEGAYPETVDLPDSADADAARILFIQAGDDYRQDALIKGTVVGIDPESGELETASNSFWIRDDTKQLKAIAQSAYAWYGTARRVMSLQTTLINWVLMLGDYVTTCDGIEVNSVISEIAILYPPWQPSPITGVPVIRYATSFGELDVMQFHASNR